MPTSVVNLRRSGPFPRAGANASFSQRAHSPATSCVVCAATGSAAPGGLKMFMRSSLRLEPELLDHRGPAIDLAADEAAQLFRWRGAQRARRQTLAKRQRHDPPQLGTA